MDNICHLLYIDKIHCFSKMFLHNREDLVNFDQVLGISSFHGGICMYSKPPFYIYKYKMLKIKYL